MCRRWIASPRSSSHVSADCTRWCWSHTSAMTRRSVYSRSCIVAHLSLPSVTVSRRDGMGAKHPNPSASRVRCSVARCIRLRKLVILDLMNPSVQWIPFCRAPAMQAPLQRLVFPNAPKYWRGAGMLENVETEAAHLEECASALASMRSLTELRWNNSNCAEMVQIRAMLPSDHKLRHAAVEAPQPELH